MSATAEMTARLRLTGESTGAVRAANDTEVAVKRMGSSARQAEGDFRSAGGGVKDFGGHARGAELATRALGVALTGLGVRALIGDMTRAAQASAGFQLGLGAVTNGALQARAEMSFVRDEALRLGLDVKTATASFMGLAGATNETALEGEKTRQIWDAVAVSGVAMGRSSEQVQRGFEAISQIASKGVVSMEEIRQQLAEAIPGAMNIAARSMGMTTAKFNELVAEGKVTSDEFLPKFAAQLRSEFAPAVDTYLSSPLGRARQEMAETQTALFDLSAVGGEAFLAGVIDGLDKLNAGLGSDGAADQVRVLARELGKLAGVGAATLGQVAQHADMVAAALAALVGIKVGSYLGEIATSSLRATSAMGVLRAGASGLLGVMGGPWGVAFAAAAGGVAWLGVEMARQEQMVRESAQTQMDHTAVLADASALLEEAGVNTRLWGLQTQNAINPTDGLTSSTRNLADQTIRLADARRQAALNNLQDNSAQLRKDIAEADRQERIAGANGLDAMVSTAVGVKADGSPLMGMRSAADVRARAQQQLNENLRAGMALMLAPPTPAAATPAAPTAGGGGKTKADRAGNLAKDLQADMAAMAAYTDALRLGAAALDDWRIKDAGRQAVEKSGLSHKAALTSAESALAAKIRASAEETERLKIANERIEKAIGLTRAADADTKALQRRTEAAMTGEAALEALAIKEAGLDALRQIGVETLDQLTGKVREEAEAAMASAEAKERQALAAAKAQRVGDTLRDLEQRIRSEEARTVAIEGGVEAEVAYARAEFARQEIERAGTTLTAEQIQQLTTKAETLFRIGAANDAADATKAEAEELRLLKMTTQEREVEERYLEAKRELLATHVDLTLQEVEARARAMAMMAQGANDNARAIGDLREGIKAAFIESGRLGFDDVADYAERRLREAVYNALLARPIDIMINAIVGNVSGGTGLSGVGTMLGGAGLGYAAGRGLGLGTGSKGADLGLSLGGSVAGSMFAGSAMAGTLGAGVANGALALGGSAAAAGSLGTIMSSAAVLGPLGAIAGLAIGSLLSGLLKDDKRPYARSDIGITNGQFAVTGGQSLDGGPLDKMNQAATNIAQSLNAAATLFKLDLTKVSNLPTSFGYVEGKNTGALGQGYFGGDGGGFSTGAQFSGSTDPEQLAADIVQATILRAIEAGASDLSEAEKNVVRSATSLEEAATKIAAGRDLMGSLDDALLQLTDPAAFDKAQALKAVEDTYQALKARAEELIAAGLVSADALAKIDQIHDLQTAEVLKQFTDAVEDAGDTTAAMAAKIKEAGDFTKSVDDQLLQMRDPKAFALQQVDEAYLALKTKAQELITAGLISSDYLAKIDQIHTLQTADVMERFTVAVEDAGEAAARAAERLKEAQAFQGGVEDDILALTDPAAARAKRINDDIDSRRGQAMTMIADGRLSADVLDQLETLRALQLDALFTDLAGAATEVRDVFAEMRPRLLDWLDQVRVSASAELNPQAQREEALAQYQSVLGRAMSGDQSALGNLTGYADRVFSADRTATASAGDRLALFNRITSEVAQVAGMSGAANDTPRQQLEQTKKIVDASKKISDEMIKTTNVSEIYTGLLTPQVENLVAANDRNTDEIIEALQVASEQTQAAVAALQEAISAGMAASAQAAAEAASAAGERQAGAMQDLVRQMELQAVYLRQRVSG